MIREPLRPGDPVYMPAWGRRNPITGTVLNDNGPNIGVRWADGTVSYLSRLGPVEAGIPPAWEPPANPDPTDRDTLGRVVREAWVRWARTQPDPKPTWLVSYDDLPEPDKEADRQIGEAVFHHLNARRIELVEKKHRGGLGPAEAEEFAVLQRDVFDLIERMHPGPPTIHDRLEGLYARLAEGLGSREDGPGRPGEGG